MAGEGRGTATVVRTPKEIINQKLFSVTGYDFFEHPKDEIEGITVLHSYITDKRSGLSSQRFAIEIWGERKGKSPEYRKGLILQISEDRFTGTAIINHQFEQGTTDDADAPFSHELDIRDVADFYKLMLHMSKEYPTMMLFDVASHLRSEYIDRLHILNAPKAGKIIDVLKLLDTISKIATVGNGISLLHTFRKNKDLPIPSRRR